MMHDSQEIFNESRWESMRILGQTRARVSTLNNSHPRLAQAFYFDLEMDPDCESLVSWKANLNFNSTILV